MTEIYIVRHGQSVSNFTDTFAGQTDAPLAENGIKQAELLCGYFKNIKIDKIYSSDLSRAYNTILPVAKEHNMEIIKDCKLREINAGYWEGVKYDEITKKYSDDYYIWLNDISKARCTGGESVEELFERVNNKFNKIICENDNKTVIVTTHGTPIRALFSYYRTGALEEMKNMPWVHNASVSHVIYKDNTREILSYDDVRHLAGYETTLPKSV